VSLDQITESRHDAATVGGGHRRPRAGLKGARALITARSTSRDRAIATCPIVRPVAGSVASSRAAPDELDELIVEEETLDCAIEEIDLHIECAG
jgi:hypothetical protein